MFTAIIAVESMSIVPGLWIRQPRARVPPLLLLGGVK